MFFQCYLQFGFHDILKEFVLFIACLTQMNYTAVAGCMTTMNTAVSNAIAAEQLDLAVPTS